MNKSQARQITMQRGVASLLMLLLVGISISVAVFGAVRFIQGSQSQTTAFHAQTQAQIKTWSGVGMLSQYVEGLMSEPVATEVDAVHADLITAKNEGVNLFAELESQNPQAYIHSIEPAEYDPTIDEYAVTVHITGTSGTGSRAAATSTIEVVYQLAGQEGEGGGGGADVPPSVITFNRDTNLGGSITVNAPADESFEINVKGQLTTGGNSINGVDTITATDSIQIGSGSTYKILRSNGDVRIDGSVTIQNSVMARGNICFTGGTSLPGLAKANGFVYGTGSASFGSIEARAQSTYFGANPKCDPYYLNDSYGVPFGVNLAGNNTAGTVKTSGGIRHHSGIIQSLQAQMDLHITNGGGRVVSGTIGGLKKYCDPPLTCQATFPAWKTDVNVNSSAGYTVPLGVLEEVEVEVPIFDAYQYENNANYAFRVNGSGYKVVTVRNVRNIANGEYYIGDYDNNEQTGWDRGYKDFLCTTLAANSTPQAPRCQAPVAEPPGTLCFGYSTYNNCITYNAGSSTWSLGGTSLSQGITWFEGNLNVGDGVYYNTFIATGNITTSGGLINYAPNYAGYSGAVDGVTYAPRGVCSNGMSVYVPAQLCNEDSTYNPEGSGGMGNYAFMAGGIVAGTYSGGNITLGSSNQSYGNILAGNDFASGGSTVINGFTTALAGGVGTLNVMGGSTTINLDVLPPSYTPTTPGTGGEDEEATISVQLLWTRYL